MDSIASAAIKYGSRRTRALLFEPFDAKFILGWWLWIGRGDPRSLELRRLRPYYRGTRGLSYVAILLMVPPAIMPFIAPFIGFGDIVYLLIVYIILFIVINVLSLFIEVSLDPILAIRHEMRLSFYKATGIFLRFALRYPGQAIRYMGAKVIADTLLLSATILFYMPAMLALIWVLSRLVHDLTTSAPNPATTAIFGVLVVIALGLAASLISMLVSVPASAFYGYYTEEAIRHMRNA